MFYKIITSIIVIICFVTFIYKTIKLYKEYNLYLNNNFKSDFTEIKKNEIYNKIKFKKPQQINVEGVIDINVIYNRVQQLKNEYNSLLNSENNNETLQENIINYKNINNNLINDINTLKTMLDNKKKELDRYVNSNVT